MFCRLFLVGVRRFELPTSATRTQRAARLRYTPNWIAILRIFIVFLKYFSIFFTTNTVKNIRYDLYILNKAKTDVKFFKNISFYFQH